MIWNEDKISMFVDLDTHPDAKPYFEAYIPKSDDPSLAGYYFHKKFFIILNVAIGGSYTGILDHTKITALNDENGQKVKMFVRSVRNFQKEEYIQEEAVQNFLVKFFQRSNIFKSEAAKVDIILDKSIHITDCTELWESLFEFVDLQKLPAQYFSKLLEYRQNNAIFQQILRMAIEKPYTGQKIIKALFIIPNSSSVNDFSFINKLNEMKRLYEIMSMITKFSTFMSQNKAMLLSNDIVIIGGNDSSYNSFADSQKHATMLS